MIRVGLLAMALVVMPVSVEARVQLKKSNPAHNSHAMLREPEVELLFSEQITNPEIKVIDYAGRVISVGVPEIDKDGDLVTMQIASPDPPRPFQGGEYKVEWRVKSKATGEPASDAYTFHLMHHP